MEILTRELAELCDVPVNTLQYWVMTGLVLPTEKTRQGAAMRFDEHEAFFAYAVAELRRRGVPLQGLREVIPGQRKVWPLVDEMRKHGAEVAGSESFYQTRRELVTWSWMSLAAEFRAKVEEMRGVRQLALVGSGTAGHPAENDD